MSAPASVILAPGAAVPGFFGKLPALGDFVTRRLPPEFVEPWDRFLQAGMAASRLRFGPAWTGHFLSAPVWRFLLSPGVISPAAWLGILLPSVDRVGRYFPLTVAARLSRGPDDAQATLRAAAAWYAALETAALAALSPRVGPDALEASLTGLLPFEPPPAAHGAACARTLWWTAGSEIAPACVLASDSLPDDARFCALLDGRWPDHGWPADAILSASGV